VSISGTVYAFLSSKSTFLAYFSASLTLKKLSVIFSCFYGILKANKLLPLVHKYVIGLFVYLE
jgi:hypothetical protein